MLLLFGYGTSSAPTNIDTGSAWDFPDALTLTVVDAFTSIAFSGISTSGTDTRITVAAQVPEPTTGTLALLGLAYLGAWRRRAHSR